MSAAILDEKTFQRFCKILKGKALHHVDTLSQECALLLDELQVQDWESVAFTAHKLKSSAGQVGAKALAAQIGALEACVAKGIESNAAVSEGEAWVEMTKTLESLIRETNQAFEVARSTMTQPIQPVSSG